MGLPQEKYVSLTTYRRTGDAVSSPVWIAPLEAGSAGFTTGLESGKVKRIRNNPAVTVQACDMRGRLGAGTTPLAARATIVVGAEQVAVAAAIKAKYGLPVSIIEIGTKLARLVGRRPEPGCAIVLRFDV